MPRETLLDSVATDLAEWIDRTANEIALAMTPRGVAPFAATLSNQQKLEYFTAQLFNPDGSPNLQGRSTWIGRLGPEGFADVYRIVLAHHPELRPAASRTAPPPPPPPPVAGG
jgi:hypothetical protein